MPRWTVPVVAATIAALFSAGVVVTVANGRVTTTAPVAAPPVTTVAPSSSTTTLHSSTTVPPATAPTSTTVAPAPSTTVAPAQAGSVESVVPTIEAFVEHARGLTFTSPVKVTLLADQEFEARVTETDPKDAEDTKKSEEVLQAMGLLDPGVDLAAVVRSFTAGAVLGFYDPKTKELVVRGTRPTPYVRSVLAHELTHALEDQHFGLDREDLGDEASAGFQALAEGSAVTVEDAYRASLSGADRAAADQEEQARGAKVPDVPEVVQVLFGFPYAFGPGLVAAIEKAGGHARLDAAYAAPPASTEQVLDPARYLKGDKPKAVPTPVADGPAIDDGEIGELFLGLMLRSEMADATAGAAAHGWGGDHYVAWKDGTRTCVRMDFVMDTPTDTTELTHALATWAGKRKATATATGTSLRTCG